MIEVHEPRISDAAAHLAELITFGRAPWEDPPTSWGRWKRPATRLPIDNAVALFIGKPRKPRVVSQEALTGRAIFCPFWHARTGVVAAVSSADEAEERLEEGRASAAEIASIADEATELADRLNTLKRRAISAFQAARDGDVRIGSRRLAFQPAPFPADPYLEAMLDTPVAPVVDALRALCKGALIARRSVTGRIADPRRAAFTASLAGTWLELTDARPTTGGPFTEFVAAAAETAGLPDADWSDAVRSLCETLPNSAPHRT